MHKTKKEILDIIKNWSMVIIGSVLLAVGNLIFLTKLNINSGGLNGIAIMIRYAIGGDENTQKLVYNIVISSLSIILWVFGLLFIGKDFAFKTLISTLAFPAATACLTYIPGISTWIEGLANASAGAATAGNILLCGIFSGVFTGVGISLTFIGGGSSGGVDVLSFMMEKFLHIKQSIASFTIDAIIVIAGLIVLPRDYLINCLCGIVAAFVAAILIDYLFIGSQSSYQVDIISKKWEQISKYAQDELDRGATIIHANGGYTGEERIILRIVFDKRQYNKLKSYIAEVDPKAFITFTRTNAVYGEGFKSHEKKVGK